MLKEKEMGIKKPNRELNSDYDIMIVGGGPAGISTWLHLHKNVVDLAEKTLLIEKARYPRDKLCGGALGGWTLDTLNELDIQIDVPQVEIDKIKCIFGENVYEHEERNFFKIIRRRDFDHSLAKTALSRGMHLHQNEAFVDFKRNGKYLLVKTSKGTYKIKV